MEEQTKLPRRRANDIEVQERIADVIKMLMGLANNTEIRTHLKEKYDIKEHNATNYIKLAHDEIKKYHKPKLQTIINAHARKYHDIVKRTEVEDPRTAILAMQGLEKLLRLTGSGEGRTYNTQVNFNLEQVETQELMALLQKIRVDPQEDIIEIIEDE